LSTPLFVKANNLKVKKRNIYAYAIVITILINRISIAASCVSLIQRNENNEYSEEITVKSLGIQPKAPIVGGDSTSQVTLKFLCFCWCDVVQSCGFSDCDMSTSIGTPTIVY
jgi:hypothetical protein